MRESQPLVLCSLLALGVLACGSSSPDNSGGGLPQDKDSFGRTIKLSNNDLSGWKQDTLDSSYSLWTKDDLTGKIDGAAPDYTDRGMLYAMYQDMVGPDPQLCTVIAMDFATDAQAKTMFDYIKDKTGADTAIPEFDASVAVGNAALSGMTVYAHLGWVYVALQLDGYSDQTLAAQTATSFLKVLEQKIK
jgi:hypothetical protein